MNNWFSRFSLWWSRFMAGRHGSDQFSLALFVLYVILFLFSSIFHSLLLYWLAAAALIWSVARMLSRNSTRRWQENEWFLGWWNPFWSRLRGMGGWFRSEREFAAMKARDRGKFRYFRCPQCGNKLRVPVGRGKVEVTCPVCRRKFVKKT